MKKKLLLLIVALPSIISMGFSQNFREWTGSGNNWNTPANWTSGGIAFGQLEWKSNGNVSSVNDAGNPFGSWRFYFSNSKSYTLTGSTVNLFDNSGAFSWVLNDATAAQNINLPLNFADAGARFSYITNRNSGSLTFGAGNNVGVTGTNIIALRIACNNTSAPITFNGTISGSRPIDIGRDDADANQVNTRVLLNGVNSSYTGVTTLYAGTLTIPANTALGSGLLILGNGAVTNTLAVTGTTTRTQNIQINDNTTASVIDVSGSNVFTLGNAGSGTLTQTGSTNTTKFGKDGTGTLTLNTASTYIGQTQIGNGTVVVSNNTGLGTLALTAIKMNGSNNKMNV